MPWRPKALDSTRRPTKPPYSDTPAQAGCPADPLSSKPCGRVDKYNMDRPISASAAMPEDVTADADRARLMFQRTVACWAQSLLTSRPVPTWHGPDPAADPANRDWRSLYRGSILDD